MKIMLKLMASSYYLNVKVHFLYFKKDGKYVVAVHKNQMSGEQKNAEKMQSVMSFGVDKTAPQIIPLNLTNKEHYIGEEKNALIVIKDNLLLEEVEVFLNGEKWKVTSEYDKYSFRIPCREEHYHILIRARDAAGNETVCEITDVFIEKEVVTN